MNTITVLMEGQEKKLPSGTVLRQAIEQLSPYGSEAVICKFNGKTVCSIDPELEETVHDGDVLEIYPLIIGG